MGFKSGILVNSANEWKFMVPRGLFLGVGAKRFTATVDAASVRGLVEN